MGAAAVVHLALVYVHASFGIVGKRVAVRADTPPRAQRVDTFVEAIGQIRFTLVDVDTGFLILRKLVTGWAGAKVAANSVGALMRAAAVSLQTLVYVQASGFIGMEVVALVTGAYVAP